MNTEYSNPNQGKSFLPLTLLALSIICFFAWQWTDITQKQTAIKNNREKLDQFVQANREKLLDQAQKAQKVQDVLQKLVLDLLEVSKTDADAKAIVTKFGIQQQANPNAAAGGAATTPASGTP